MIEDYYRQLGISVKVDYSKSNLENTNSNYKYIYNLLKGKKIKYVAMQYPTLDVQNIVNFFNLGEQKNIIFVSNEKNFEKTLSTEKYEDYFVDNFGQRTGIRFRGDFGHTTAKGSKLIAENAANAIFKELNISNT